MSVTIAGNSTAVRTLASSRTRTAVAAFALLVLTLAVYAQVARHEFVNYDDRDYVYKNEHVTSGITVTNVKWAFTSNAASNWHPLTWISHMLDVQLFGLNAGAHHVVNLLIHCANVLLIFSMLFKWSGSLPRSATVAALFAVHPLNVENVAWIAERKSLLSTLFGLLAIAAYVAWVKRRSVGSYLVLLLVFACSLMAKPMLVTLPVLLIVVDYWPLGRFDFSADAKRKFATCVVEKLPLLALSAGSSIVTYVVQSSHGSTAGFPLRDRILNALMSYVWYLEKAVVPSSLACFYPHEANLSSVSPVLPIIAAVVLIGITALLFIYRTRAPYALAGWLWYGIALAPVIGIIQVGMQAHADRYAYIPLLGIFVAVVWGIANEAERLLVPMSALAALAAVVVISFGAVTARQTSYWRDSGRLWTHALAVDSNNWLAWFNLGTHYEDLNRQDEALRCYLKVISLDPSFYPALVNAAVIFGDRLDRPVEASQYYLEALRYAPDNANTWTGLGKSQLELRRIPDAIDALDHALKLDPYNENALYEQACALAAAGRTDEALGMYAVLRRVSPVKADALVARGFR